MSALAPRLRAEKRTGARTAELRHLQRVLDLLLVRIGLRNESANAAGGSGSATSGPRLRCGAAARRRRRPCSPHRVHEALVAHCFPRDDLLLVRIIRLVGGAATGRSGILRIRPLVRRMGGTGGAAKGEGRVVMARARSPPARAGSRVRRGRASSSRTAQGLFRWGAVAGQGAGCSLHVSIPESAAAAHGFCSSGVFFSGSARSRLG